MAIREIIQPNNPTLRQKARKVTTFDDELQTLIDDMIETMREADGAGLAAPQVDVPLRVAVIETLPDLDDEGNPIEDTRDLYVIVNPEIIWESQEVVDGIEGCLSIPGYLGEVTRYQSVRVRAQDRHGKRIRLRLHDWDARIFQHEIDHLDGILYIDRLTAPENLWTEEEYMEKFGADEDEAEEVVT
ncbi:MAG TPA: peptide deformylase [Candidatus Sulfomarinibacteraceae bacterium]|nr:peptide deformylase [Candidatus Sulfomarinibacteraceae bacterium]